ncbi:MAG TPA: anthranilate synthase component I family protein, partial [Nitrosopumilaceae archaeon]|nr:anthranilate synthase component I family protein [Nitrosopumilaceae archaeon]
FSFNGSGDLLKVYKILRDLNPSPYLYHVKMNDKTTIGASPEMLIRVTNDQVETFPIAGTRKITDDESKNEELKRELLNDEKEIAEHTMLVDLGRNDIGRVCKYGSVHVEEFMKVKQFSHVQHMVTHVVGKLDKKYDMFDAFKAVFPAGTVSGAPKVRAMEIIEELEPQSRGPYAGAVGYFSFNGCCDFAIAIRSIFFDGEKGFVQSGAGIVSDSIPENEFKETEHKADAMITALRDASN